MTAEASQGKSYLSAAAFAVFAGALVVAFLANRGGDIGQLPQLIGDLGSGPLLGEGSASALVGLVCAGCIAISWAGLGEAVLRLLPEAGEVDGTLMLCIRVATGAAAWSLVWFILGLAGLYNTVTAFVCVAVGLVTFFIFRASRAEITNPRAKLLPMVLLGATPLFLSVVSASAPPIAKDTLLYHFALPKVFVAHNSNAFIDGNIASYLALGTEMHYVWAMLVGSVFGSRSGEAAMGVTGFLFFPLLLTIVTLWLSELKVSRTWAMVAMVMVATVPTAYHAAASGYIDIALASFVTLAAYALARWWKEQTTAWLILLGIFLGAALSIKLSALFVIAAFALVILLRARGADNAGKVVLAGFAALLLAGVTALPWYVRTWAATGSPVFPFYMSIWKGAAPGWDVERSNLFQAMNSQYGGADKNALNYLTAPVRASVAAQPEQPEFYDGVLGVAFLIGLPVLGWALWKFEMPVDVKIAAGVAGIVYLFWLFSSQQIRYLLPILPLLANAIAAAGQALSKRIQAFRPVLTYSLLAACIAALLTSVAWFAQKAPLRVVLGGESRDEYLSRNLDYYPYYQIINSETEPDAKVWLINMRRDTYNIERPVMSDYLFEDWTLREMVWASRTGQELKARTAAMGIKYILARHDFLFDYDRSTLVDEKRPRAENGAKLKMARELILDPANTIKADGKFSLVKVFSE